MIDLLECRKQIDEIDSEILELFEKRMSVCEDVARFKIATGKKVLDPQREQEKITTLRGKAHGEFYKLGVQELFQQIMAISRKRQYQLLTENESSIENESIFQLVDKLPMEHAKVVFQGVEGAYSCAAMKAYFGEEIKSFHVKTWKDAMEAVCNHEADYAVLPIENSTAGTVSDIYDLLTEYKLFIVGEQIISVNHVLLGLEDAELADIKKVYSHPQGLAQCVKFLESHPEWETIKTENTAGSAKKVSEDGEKCKAAIASREAGRLYGLKILAENICNNEQNVTKFIIVGKNPFYTKDARKISVCIELPHVAGSLYNILSHIIYNGLNMTKIESRPIAGKTWEYRFFIDFEGNLDSSAVKNAIRGFEAEANVMRVLGNYELQEEA